MCEGRFFIQVITSCQRTRPAQTQLLKASISNGAVTTETGREWFKRHIVEGKKEHVATYGILHVSKQYIFVRVHVNSKEYTYLIKSSLS